MKIPLSQLDMPERDLRASVDADALDELAESLRAHGQLQPIGVKTNAAGRFEVVFGARRTRAARLLGWSEIEAVEVEENNAINQAAQKLIENVQRENLTPIEEAYGLLELIGDGEADVRALQRQTGKSREWIKSRLALIDLPEDIQGAVQAGVIGIGVARQLGTIENPDIRQQYTTHAAEYGCTEDQARVWAGQAQFAETGMLSAQQTAELQQAITNEPQIVDQKFHCFICSNLHSWREVNTLVICGPCQSQVTRTRTV